MFVFTCICFCRHKGVCVPICSSGRVYKTHECTYLNRRVFKRTSVCQCTFVFACIYTYVPLNIYVFCLSLCVHICLISVFFRNIFFSVFCLSHSVFAEIMFLQIPFFLNTCVCFSDILIMQASFLYYYHRWMCEYFIFINGSWFCFIACLSKPNYRIKHNL